MHFNNHKTPRAFLKLTEKGTNWPWAQEDHRAGPCSERLGSRGGSWEGKGLQDPENHPLHTHIRSSQLCCKLESPGILAKADSQALRDYLNLTFQKRGTESRHTPATTQELYHQARVGNSAPRSHLWVPVLCAHFPFVLPEPEVNCWFKGPA